MAWFYDPALFAISSSDINATFAKTIDPVTLSATAALPISATFDQTIDAITLAAMATVEGAVVTPAPARGGVYYSDEYYKAHEDWRKKRRKHEQELEEVLRQAYERLNEPKPRTATPQPERLSTEARSVAAQLAGKSEKSAKLKQLNRAIIADLKRLAYEITEIGEQQKTLERQRALVMEEESIVMLLAA